MSPFIPGRDTKKQPRPQGFPLKSPGDEVDQEDQTKDKFRGHHYLFKFVTSETKEVKLKEPMRLWLAHQYQ